MNTQSLEMLVTYINAHPFIFLSIIIWSLVWKLIALWKAVKRDNLTIFIILAVLNTVGIAEIIYITYLYSKEKNNIKIIK